MVFLANLGVNLHVCLCGDLQVASAQTLDFLDIGQKSSFPDWKLSSTAKSFSDGNSIGASPDGLRRAMWIHEHAGIWNPAALPPMAGCSCFAAGGRAAPRPQRCFRMKMV
ncbi:exported hypothetical protein [uncultured Desulfatiglans sp.]|nr:exported hypothetical protein [uncultured Desulfatiglans sp.]